MNDNSSVNWKDNNADALRFSHQLREFHHKSLWEEEKHYTWLHSIILAAQVAVIAKQPVELASRNILLTTLAIIGFLLSIVAYQVVSREGNFFVYAHNIFVNYFNKMFPQNTLEATENISNILILPIRALRGKATIREYFQFVFLIFGTIDVLLILGVLLCKV